MRDPHDLYGLPLEQFVPARQALAKELRAQQRREEAKEVASLRKPSVAAWAVNQLVRSQSREVAELFEAGDALQQAQSQLVAGSGDGATLREAVRRERDAVSQLERRARGLLDDHGHELSATTLERLSETFHAAALEEAAREKVKGGRLERELRHVGLGEGVLGAPPGPAPPKRKAQRKPAQRPDPQRLKAARKREADARRAADRAERDLQRAQKARDQAADSLEQAEQALQAAREAADRATREHHQAKTAMERL